MPNTKVSNTRIRVWMIEVAVLVLFLFGIVLWFTISVNNEKDRATKREEAVLVAGCKRINSNAQSILGLVEFAVKNGPQPPSESAQAFIKYAQENIKVIDCNMIPERLNGNK